MDFPETGNFPSSEINCSHGNALVASTSASNVVASNSPTSNFRRSAVRNHKLQRGIADIGALKRTLPFSTSTGYPICLTSFATIDSKPIAAVAINVIVVVIFLILSLFKIKLVSVYHIMYGKIKKMPITETIKNLSYSTLAIRKVFYRIDRCILDKPCSVPLYSNGGQPCTPVVIIYLQVFTRPFFGSNSLIKDAPTIVWVAHSWGLPVPPGMFPSRLRHCGTFKVSIPYLKRRRNTSCR